MGGPFLVPIRKGVISHFERVHELCEQQGLVDRDEVGFEGSTKVCPGAKVGGSEGKGCLLFILSPFPNRGTKFKVSESCGNAAAFVHEDILIEVVVIFKGCPEGISFGGSAIKRFGGCSNCFGIGRGCSSRHGWSGLGDWGCGLLCWGFRAGGKMDLGSRRWDWIG